MVGGFCCFCRVCGFDLMGKETPGAHGWVLLAMPIVHNAPTLYQFMYKLYCTNAMISKSNTTPQLNMITVEYQLYLFSQTEFGLCYDMINVR